MIHRFANVVLCCLLTITAACAQSRVEQGTDGVTHWLAECESTAECGALQCLCGVCTSTCDDDTACTQFGATAACLSLRDSSCVETVQVCAAPSTEPSELDSGYRPGSVTLADASVVDDGIEPDGASPSILDASVVHDGLIRGVSRVSSPYATPDDELLFLWWIRHDPTMQYYPQPATYEGDLTRFAVTLPEEPPLSGRYLVNEDGDGGAIGPVLIASTWLYHVVGGKLDANPSGVNALDVDIVIGQTDGLLIWTPVEIPTSWVLGADRAGTLTPGYHLFIDFEEVDLSTMITMINEIRT